MSDALDNEIAANVRRSNEATRLRAVQTPGDVKLALSCVGSVLAGAVADEQRRADGLDAFRQVREYLGFLQMTCAANLPATAPADAE